MFAALPLFIASLLGSLHCAGMCGGFVAMYSAQAPARWRAHLAYSLGRLCTYSVLGLLAFFLGSQIDRLGEQFGLPKISALIVGILLISAGIGMLLRRSAAPLNLSWFEKFGLGRCLAGVLRSPDASDLRSFLIGLLSTTLPCGWLYSFVGVAATSGSALEACGVMLVFWLGTLPIMLGLAQVVGRLGARLLRIAPLVTAVLLVCAGFVSMRQHLAPHDHSQHQHGHHH